MWGPTELPKLRDELCEFLVWISSQPNAMAAASLGSPEMSSRELSRVSIAELFHVTEDMSALVSAAAASMPEFTLSPHDLPSEAGLVCYSRPMGEAPGTGLPIVALSWGPSFSRDFHGVCVTNYVSSASLIDQMAKRGVFTDQELGRMRTDFPALWPQRDVQIPFSETPILSDNGENPVVHRTLRTTWMLMAQTVASVHVAHHDRAARRRFQKAGQDPPSIRIISLRRSRPEKAEGSESEREYQHQWVVRGHWRKQWYPSVNDHRPVWIAPHIKGPEGAPLLGGERVYSLKR